ncbi:hypothetical protein [Bacillus pumilus]|uniref:hypothetical protein n=1 Tax=Bacillus pumilus TaxID=1408 RepID=UPI0031F563B0
MWKTKLFEQIEQEYSYIELNSVNKAYEFIIKKFKEELVTPINKIYPDYADINIVGENETELYIGNKLLIIRPNKEFKVIEFTFDTNRIKVSFKSDKYGIVQNTSEIKELDNDMKYFNKHYVEKVFEYVFSVA